MCEILKIMLVLNRRKRASIFQYHCLVALREYQVSNDDYLSFTCKFSYYLPEGSAYIYCCFYIPDFLIAPNLLHLFCLLPIGGQVLSEIMISLKLGKMDKAKR